MVSKLVLIQEEAALVSSSRISSWSVLGSRAPRSSRVAPGIFLDFLRSWFWNNPVVLSGISPEFHQDFFFRISFSNYFGVPSEIYLEFFQELRVPRGRFLQRSSGNSKNIFRILLAISTEFLQQFFQTSSWKSSRALPEIPPELLRAYTPKISLEFLRDLLRSFFSNSFEVSSGMLFAFYLEFLRCSSESLSRNSFKIFAGNYFGASPGIHSDFLPRSCRNPSEYPQEFSGGPPKVPHGCSLEFLQEMLWSSTRLFL